MMTTNLFVIANVKQLRTGGSFRILLPFVRTSWGVGVLNSAIFNSFHNRVGFGTILEGPRNFGGGWGLTPPPQPVRHCKVSHSFHLHVNHCNFKITLGAMANIHSRVICIASCMLPQSYLISKQHELSPGDVHKGLYN